MARVKGPNGLVLTVPDDVAAGLVLDADHEYVEDEKKPEPKAAAKRSAAKK